MNGKFGGIFGVNMGRRTRPHPALSKGEGSKIFKVLPLGEDLGGVYII